MKKKIICAITIVTITALSSTGALAAPQATTAESSISPDLAVADVTSQVNIRTGASIASSIVGYLPRAAAADVIDKGDEWSHIISGEVEGYIKNEYLAFGDRAETLAGIYGRKGVEVSWDDVKLFSRPDDCSRIIEQADAGDEYELVGDEGIWFSVLAEDGTTIYVPAEDVKKTFILDKAVAAYTASSTSSAESVEVANHTSSQETVAETNHTSSQETVAETETAGPTDCEIPADHTVESDKVQRVQDIKAKATELAANDKAQIEYDDVARGATLWGEAIGFIKSCPAELSDNTTIENAILYGHYVACINEEYSGDKTNNPSRYYTWKAGKDLADTAAGLYTGEISNSEARDNLAGVASSIASAFSGG